MNNEVTEAEARFALSSIEHRRQQVIAEIDVPPWYWFGVAGGWDRARRPRGIRPGLGDRRRNNRLRGSALCCRPTSSLWLGMLRRI